jgi:lipoprotein-anchoring transpeptidase ErfK/SrfK
LLLVALLLGALVLSACTQAAAPQALGSTTPNPGTASSDSAPAGPSTVTGPPSASSTPPSVTSAAPVTSAPPKAVHVSLLENDGGVYGVGMPIIAWFSVAPTDATGFAKATTVTVNGKAIVGAWYFEPPTRAGFALEAHFRPATYWPGHASIMLNLPIQGLSAGKGLAFDNSLTLTMSTGAAHIATVDATTLVMTVMTDGKLYGRFPVSLGASNTPTSRGTKVIMQKGLDISMTGPGYFDPHVKFTQRLTYSGEYLHSAPWNVANIGHRSSSNGCTNLLPAQAEQLYDYLRVGDVVLYPNASGPQMTLQAGYGDWNVSWSQWLTGGALATT